MIEHLDYMDVRARGVFTSSKTPIYYFTVDGMPNAFSVIAHMIGMDERVFKKMMRQFGAKKYGYWLVFKDKECIEDALCWLKVVIK